MKILGICMVIVGGLMSFAGCTSSSFCLLSFDTTVSTDPMAESYGYHVPRVQNMGLMHQQQIGIAIGVVFFVLGIVLSATGLILWVIASKAPSGPPVPAK